MRQLRRIILVLIAVAALTGAVAAATPARATLTVEPLLGGATHVTVTVADGRGTPMERVAVTVRAKTTFGWLIVAESKTDKRGQIHLGLPASSRFAEIAAEAGDAETVQAAVRLNPVLPASPAVRPGYATLARVSPQPGFISPYPVPLHVVLLGLILGGVWATYGYVVSLLVQIRRTREAETHEKLHEGE